MSAHQPLPRTMVRQPFPPHFYRALLALLFFAFSATILIPIMPLYVTDELGARESWIGTATLVLSLTAVASRIPSGALSDRRGRRMLMLLGALCAGVAGVLYVLSHSIGVFLLARIFSGAGIGIFTTASKALSVDVAPPSRRGEALGLNNAAFSVAGILSPLLGEGLKNLLSFQAVFVVSGVLGLIALATTYTLPEDHPDYSESAGARRDATLTLRQRGSWAAILLIIGAGALLTLMYTFYPLIAERKALFADAPGLISAVAMGLGLSIWSLVDTVIEPIAGRVSDVVGRQPVAVPGLLVAALGTVLLSRASGTWAVYATIAIMAAGWGTARAAADSVAQDAIPPALRGMGAAILYTSFDLAVGVDAQVLGTLIDGANFDTFFAALLMLLLVFGLPGLILTTRLHTFEKRAANASPGPSGALPPHERA